MVNVDGTPLAVGMTEGGTNVQDAPLGSPPQLSVTWLLNPLSEVTDTVAVALSPGVIRLGVVEAGAVTAKSLTAKARVE
jgi:hypothetical protein